MTQLNFIMNKVSKTILILITLNQLGACAVISKKECLNADWYQIGKNVAFNGNTDLNNAFDRRKRTCEKHGEIANWQRFQQGHSDGIVEYCQLRNAVLNKITLGFMMHLQLATDYMN